MKVWVRPADESGCGFYRMTEPAAAVAAAYPDIDVDVFGGIHYAATPDHRVEWVDTRQADVVVLQHMSSPQLVRRFQAQGVAVVVEVDDLLSAVPPENIGHRYLTRYGVPQLVAQAAAAADWVTVSTPALLAEYAPHGRGTVIRNAVPRRLAELPPAYERTPDRVTIGWTGKVGTHPHDLPELAGGLTCALATTQARFLIFGNATGAAPQLGFDPTEVPGIRDVARYVTALGEHLDVGVAPLRRDKFNLAKSWLKPLEYAARGVFGVYSPLPEYAALGLGAPAADTHAWAAALVEAVTSTDRRTEMAAANRAVVLDRHLTEHTAPAWASAWRAAADHHTRQRIHAEAS